MRPCLVLTRPRPTATDFAQKARAAGWHGEILVAPLMEITLTPPAPKLLDEAAVLIFTSQHGIESFTRATSARHWPVWTVGPRTAAGAHRAGFTDIAQASGGNAASLLADLNAAAIAGPVLHLHGAHLACDLTSHLRARGLQAHGCVVYDQRPVALCAQARARLQQGGDLVLSTFSPRSSRLLRTQILDLNLSRARLHMIAISTAAATELQVLPLIHSRIADTPDAAGMLAALGCLQAALEPSEKPS
ncbi:MAG: uroporphyrinogen-III synthase [Rhodobacteraceae bacterium]|nr:MAG: uroporphyrinogen-III synthase [Paracoccaceae bacterium]